MKTYKLSSILCSSIILFSASHSAFAQFGGFKVPKTSDVKKAVEKEVKDEVNDAKKEAKEEVKETTSPASSEPQEETRSGGRGGGRSGGLGGRSGGSVSNGNSPEKVEQRNILGKLSKVFYANADNNTHISDLVADAPLIDKLMANFSVDNCRTILADDKRELSSLDNMIKNAPTVYPKVLDALSREVYDRAENTKSASEKLELYEKLRMWYRALERLTPGDATLTAKNKELDKVSGGATKQLSGVVKNPFHLQNVNKILYSNKAVNPETATAADFKTSFTAGEPLYATLFLDNTLSKIHVDWEKFIRIQMYKGKGNDIIVIDRKILLTPEMYKNAYVQFPIIPDKVWLQNNYGAYADKGLNTYIMIFDALGKLTPIRHDLRMDIRLNPVEGTHYSAKEAMFSIDLGEGSEVLQDVAASLSSVNLSKVNLPKAGMSNASMEAAMLKIMKDKSTVQDYKKAIITSSGWTVEKNELGIILNKYVSATLASKNEDGKCYIQSFTFKYDYVGGGNYSSTLTLGSVGNKVEIECEKIK
ncbi:MAG: hypothetical protein JNL32_09280 [Candidatus Kapabacteria bacterium]|nr:hypothetical protein [Candidatus Kapabacteria bacterium]